MSTPLGPFDLLERIGAGGMGEVWRGVHRVGSVPVAVKVLRPALRRNSKLVTAFRNEVRQVAKLEHPGIVLVLDYGTVSEQTQEASEDNLVAGSPYLAMEYASAGALDEALTDISWTALRTILLSVLDALAHAHARGVLHRDIKPANVLLASIEDLRPGIKLTDFGIAQALRDPLEEDPMQGFGTPEYMAPEQVLGEWRRQGPWTDLYALGAVAWQLCTGKVMFQHNSPMEIARAQIQDELPDFAPLVDVPDGFEEWIRRLLAKNPEHRFQFAADAAWALQDLGRIAPTASRRSAAVAAPQSGGSQNTWLLDEADRDDPDLLATGFADSDIAPSTAPPIPESWRPPEALRPPPRLAGAGLGLFGMRPVPLVGRTRERDRIWRSLRNANRTGRPRAVLLRGPAGIGKTRLAWWIADRAHEVGAARVLWATHSPLPGPAHGVGRMIARHLRCVGLSTDGLHKRIGQLGGELGIGDQAEREELARWLLSSPGADQPSGRYGPRPLQPRERYGLVVRFLERLGADRPVILVLDDIQWGADALAFLAHLLSQDRARRLPVLVLMACREEALAPRVVESRLVKQLEERRDVTTFTLGALGRRDRRALVRHLLALDHELARDLDRRTAGNPLFAVELVGDWVRRGVLELGDDGFRLEAGERARLPDDIHVVWKGWVSQVLDYQPTGARDALEVAAALGLQVDEVEWTLACRERGVKVPEYLQDALFATHLAEPTDGGWAFVHEMLRESVERESIDAGRWRRVQLACAAMLGRRQRTRGNSARLGHHLLVAGQKEDALSPLLAGVQECILSGDYPAAWELLEQRSRVIEALRLPPDDRHRGQGVVEQVRIHIGRGEFTEGEALAVKGVELARRHEWSSIQCRCQRYLGMLAEKRGDLARAEGEFREALALAREFRYPEEEAACLEHRGSIRRTIGDREGSLRYLERARLLYERLGDRHGTANCLKEIGGTLVTLGEPTEAAEILQAAADQHQAQGNPSGRAECLNGLGEVHRRLGDLGAAEEAYREAFELMDRAEAGARIYPQVNLGLVLVLRGEALKARSVLRAALKDAEASDQRVVQAWVHSVMLQPLAELGAWKAFDTHVRKARALIAQTGLVDPDVASVAATASTVAEAAGHRERARRVSALAEAQARGLEQD